MVKAIDLKLCSYAVLNTICIIIYQSFKKFDFVQCKSNELQSRSRTSETSYIYIYGDDQSGRVPQREFQHIGPIVHQNVMIFFINYSTYLVLRIYYYFDYLPCLKSMKVSVLLICFSKMNFYQAYPCQ